jgi:hypothetical protein
MPPSELAPLPFLSIGAEARGFIAIGNVATGVVAIGATFATGVVAVGTNALGSFVAIGLNAAGLITVSIANGLGVFLLGAVNGLSVFGGARLHTAHHPALGAAWAIGSALIGLVLHPGLLGLRGAVAGDKTLGSLLSREPRACHVRARLSAAGPDGLTAVAEGGKAVRLVAEASIVARAAELLARSRRPDVELDVEASDEVSPGPAASAYRQAASTTRVLRCRGVEPRERPSLAARTPELERASLLAAAAVALAAAVASSY